MLLGVLLFSAMVPNVKVTDFGASPGSRADATLAVAKALEATKAGGTLEFPPGDYHFYRQHGFERELFLSNSDVVNPRRISILIENRSNIRITGKGARLVFHDRVMPIAVLASQDIAIDGLVIDWERPLMSQGTVASANANGFSLRIDREKYPYVIEGGQLLFTDTTWKAPVWGMMEFDSATKGIAYKTGDEGFTDGGWSRSKLSEPEPGVVHFEFSEPARRWPKVGNVIAIRHGVRDHAGTFILDSKNVRLTDVKYRHTSGLGVLSQYSENLTFKEVDVAPDPSSDRVFAGHDDGFHFSNCKGHISVENCSFQGLMDDPINVHGTSVRIEEIKQPNVLRCRFMHHQSVGMRFGDPGDTISILDEGTMLSIQKTKIVRISHLSTEEFEVEIDAAISKWAGIRDALENLTWTPSLTVRGSTFGRVRARGLLVTTPKKVMIENNVFRSSGSAILICGDARGWFESGSVTDVTIRKNLFEDCNSSGYQFGRAIITILPEVRDGGAGSVHRNIRIEENVFRAFQAPILCAWYTSDLVFRNNVIELSKTFPPRQEEPEGLVFGGCTDVRVEGNRVDPAFPGRTFRVAGGKPETMFIDWPGK